MNHSHLSASLTPCLASLALCLLMISSCNTPREQTIPANTISALQHELCALYTDADADRMGRGIQQAAALWTEEDGTTEEFCRMVKTHYCGTDSARRALFGSVSKIIEQCYESADLLTVDLLKPTQLTNAGEPEVSDWIMSAYSPLAHFADDMFANRLAFVTIINVVSRLSLFLTTDLCLILDYHVGFPLDGKPGVFFCFCFLPPSCPAAGQCEWQ